jgi:pSer/pThr/pTyr-binding forkhead associated (FHA) protein
MRGVEATLGRALGSTIRIPSSEVSRLHCRLRIENGLVTVEDLESVNGTFLNGARVHNVETVRPGDRLSLGPVTFVVEYEIGPEALQITNGEEDLEVLPVDEELQLIDESAAALEDDLPVAQPLDELEGDELLLDDEDEMHLPEGGDLRDFLIELDEADNKARKREQ